MAQIKTVWDNPLFTVDPDMPEDQIYLMSESDLRKQAEVARSGQRQLEFRVPITVQGGAGGVSSVSGGTGGSANSGPGSTVTLCWSTQRRIEEEAKKARSEIEQIISRSRRVRVA